nr:hypothetical protein [Azospirillum sp. SYSU D00513]
MGVLIVAGFWIVGAELYRRMNDPERRAATAVPAVEAPAPGNAPVEVPLDVPPGSRIEEMLAVGSRVLLRVTVPNGADRIYVMDPRNGAVTVTVTAGRKETVQ